MQRLYQATIEEQLSHDRQMVFLAGPRQVGKTTLGKQCLEGRYPYQYLNWDSVAQREQILLGAEKLYEAFSPNVLMENEITPVLFFDELHKYRKWKNLLKGYFDELGDRCKIMVSGSAKLNVYRKGGDSMMGRYFLYHIHPLSVAEINGRKNHNDEIIHPSKISDEDWETLLKFGGFPEPFYKATQSFYNRWVKLKQEQLFQEDLRDLNKVHNIAQIELLSQLLIRRVSSVVKYTELAKQVQISEPTIRNWISVLREVYFCFQIKPWSKNISRSLLKIPKIYCWDWSIVDDPGSRNENLVAVHLHKAVNYWTDIGLGNYELYYLRDKENREVDFLVTKNKKPWLMVEVKSSGENTLDSNLLHFQGQLNVPHVLQVATELPYVNKDCFAVNRPMIVSLRTFLSQLV